MVDGDSQADQIARLKDRDDVAVESETIELDEEQYDPDDTREDEGGAAVGAVVYDDEGRILLVRNYHEDGWLFPGGMARYGEPLEREAAREVREETGIDPDILAPIRVVEQRFVFESVGEAGRLPFVLYEGYASADPADPDELGEFDDEIESADWFAEVPEESRQSEDVTYFLERGPQSGR